MKKTIAKPTKKTQFKYYFLIVLSALFLSGTSDHSVLAYTLTVEAIEDGGLIPLQEPFARFDKRNSSEILHVVPNNPPPGSQWNDRVDVDDYASANNLPDWWLWSAGNIWSTDDKIVGESLEGLSAGTYRISAVGGAFTFDSFDWSPYFGKYYWQLQIQGFLQDDTPIGPPQMLGSIGDYLNPDDAYYDNLGKYVDIDIPSGGSLVFWIDDTNALDNAGSLTFNVTPIPEPATVILLGTGMLFLAKRFRRHSSHR